MEIGSVFILSCGEKKSDFSEVAADAEFILKIGDCGPDLLGSVPLN